MATVTAGTAAADPVPNWASVPTTDLVIAIVWVEHAATAIYTTDVRQVFWVKETNNISSLSIENDYINPEGTAADDIIRLYTGCKVNELSYSVSRGQTNPIRFIANMIARKEETSPTDPATVSTITDSTADFFLEWNTEIEVASGTNYDLNDFSFSINNNLKARGTDGRHIKKLIPGNRAYSASGKIDLLDKEEIERFYGADGSTEPGDTIGTFTVKHTLKKPAYELAQFIFSTCAYNKAPTSDPLDDVIGEDLDIAIGSCQVMLVDATETY